MKLTNAQIYNYLLTMNKAFENFTEPLPAKLNFYINKNQQSLFNYAQIIERTRDDIFNTEESDEIKQSKLEELSIIEQDVDIKMIPMEWLSNDIKFTPDQMQSIMFMIDDSVEVNE